MLEESALNVAQKKTDTIEQKPQDHEAVSVALKQDDKEERQQLPDDNQKSQKEPESTIQKQEELSAEKAESQPLKRAISQT